MTTKSALKHQIRVGAFVGVSFMILLVSLFMVGGDRMIKEYVILHAHFDHVQGLNEGSVVSLQGIRVGDIQKFVFVPEQNQVDVFMKIDKQYLSRITAGATVEVRTAGALGDKFIFINPGPHGQPSLKNGDVLSIAPVSDIMGVLSEKGGEATKIFDIISEVHKITKAINAENRIDKMMKNFTEASQNLKETSTDTKQMMAEFRGQNSKKLNSAVDKLDRILTKIDRGDGTLGALINDSSLHDSLKSMIGGSDRKKNMKSLIRSSIEKNE